MRELSIDRRYCGPPDSGNGGYVAGLVASRVGGGAEVTLRRPPPLGQSLSLRELRSGDADTVELWDAEGALAVGRAASLELAVPEAPSWAEAVAASAGVRGRPHPYPTCFVCGPDRAEGDGLRILPGPLGAAGHVAAPWIPHASLADARGAVSEPVVWAALDCPGALAVMGPEPRPMLLGRIHACLERPVHAGRRYVAVGFRLGDEGRKHFAGTALYDAEGRPCGRSHQVWIEPRRAAA
jgi:hypothetical protein